MAQLFIQVIDDSSNISTSSLALCKIFEQNLSDEWLCHVAVDEGDAKYLVIVSPDLGLLILNISRPQRNEFEEFFQRIPKIQQDCLDTTISENQKHKQLCDDKGDLTFPVGFGLIFPELSSDELDISIGVLERFSIFSDVLNELTPGDDGLEDLLYDMMEDIDIIELGDKHIENINDIVPNIFVSLKTVSHAIVSDSNNLSTWWNSLEEGWKEHFTWKFNNATPTSEHLEELLKETKHISMYHERISSLEPLKYLENIESITFDNCNITGTLEPLRNLMSLIHIDVSGSDGFDSLEPVKGLTNLESLYCDSTSITSLEPLRKLKNLKELRCHNNYEIETLDPLYNLVHLEKINCHSTSITSLEPLKYLVNLEKLDAIGTVVSLEPLQNLKKLKSIQYGPWGWSDVNLQGEGTYSFIYQFRRDFPLPRPTNPFEGYNPFPFTPEWWEELDEEWKSIFNEHLGDKESLNLEDKLFAIPKIKKIDISNKTIHSLKALSAMPLLVVLIADNTKITNLEHIKNIQTLRELSLCNTDIDDIEPLFTLNLFHLNISGTNLKSFNQLEHLDMGLKYYLGYHDSINDTYLSNEQVKVKISLNISNTNVENIEFIHRIPYLTTLHIDNTMIERLVPVECLKRLNELSCNNSLIDDVSMLRDHKNIEYLYINNTKVMDLSPLQGVKQLKSIEATHLGIASIDMFRDKYPFPHEIGITDKVEDKKGIEYFAYHLESLGYYSEKDTAGENDIILKCSHPNKVDIRIVPVTSTKMILFQRRWSYENINFNIHYAEIVHLINKFNASKIISCSSLSPNDMIVCQCLHAECYSKEGFACFFEIFIKETEELYAIISKLEDPILPANGAPI